MRTTLIVLLALFSTPLMGKTLWGGDTPSSKEAPSRIVKQGDDSWDLRSKRRVGIGFSAAGPLGFLGLNMELNFSPKWGAVAGFGGGRGYQSYTFQAKRVLAGEWLAPYMAMGYSRWMSTREGEVAPTTPGFLYDRFLTDAEKQSGNFSEDLVFPAFGLQYLQLRGPWSGFSVFAEVLMLLDVEDFQTAPTGTLGMLYYF